MDADRGSATFIYLEDVKIFANNSIYNEVIPHEMRNIGEIGFKLLTEIIIRKPVIN